MRSRRRLKSRTAIVILGITTFLSLLFYFGAYSTLHVKVADSRGFASVEYWCGLSRLDDQRFWRAFFGVAHRLDRVLWSDSWEPIAGIGDDDLPLDPLAGMRGRRGDQFRMFSESMPLETMPSGEVRFPSSLILDGGVLPASAPGPVQIEPR